MPTIGIRAVRSGSARAENDFSTASVVTDQKKTCEWLSSEMSTSLTVSLFRGHRSGIKGLWALQPTPKPKPKSKRPTGLVRDRFFSLSATAPYSPPPSWGSESQRTNAPHVRALSTTVVEVSSSSSSPPPLPLCLLLLLLLLLPHQPTPPSCTLFPNI